MGQQCNGLGTHLHLTYDANNENEYIISTKSKITIWKNDELFDVPDGWVQVSNYIPQRGKYWAIWNNKISKTKKENKSNEPILLSVIYYGLRVMNLGKNNNFATDFDYIYSPLILNGSDYPKDFAPNQVNLGKLNKKFDYSTLVEIGHCNFIWLKPEH